MTVNAAIGNGFIDWRWMMAQKAAGDTEFVRHIALDNPIEILIDGRGGAGLILRPK